MGHDTDNADTRSLYSNVLQYDYLFKVSADYPKKVSPLSADRVAISFWSQVVLIGDSGVGKS